MGLVRRWTPDSWWLDVKLGLRMLIKHPGLALVGAFGIAVAVAIAAGGFSVTYDSFLAPSLPLDEGDRLVSIEMWDSATSKPESRILRDYHLWRDELKSIQEIGAFITITANLITPGARPQSIRVAAISASGFNASRVQPLIGRRLTKDDERDGAPSVIVIGESVWRTRFGGDPAILGRTIQLGMTPHSVVGVMPEGFAFPVNHRFWIPLRVGSSLVEPLTGPDLMVFGRLAPGFTLESARAELAAIGRRTALTFPKIYAQLRPQALPYPHPFVGIHQSTDVTGLHVTNAIITTLLVLVCLNVAILVYTRTAMRQSEISVRSALGASRSRIVAQLFIEALVLSAVGTLTGVAIAEFALRQMAHATLQIASELPFWLSFHLSPEAVVYAGALSVIAAAIIGVLPALQATKSGLQSNTRVTGSSSGMRLGKTWMTLVVAQVGFAVALLPSAVSTTWENLRAEFVESGIAAEKFLTAELGMDNLESGDAAGERDFARRYAIRQNELLLRLQSDPRVSSATFSMAIPGDEPTASIEASGAASRSGTSSHKVRVNRIDVNFFRALDVPILAGRAFELSDVAAVAKGLAGRPVVVNQSFAQRVFGGDALGRRLRYAAGGEDKDRRGGESGDWYEIIGIVRDFPAGVSPGMNDSPLRVYHAIAAGEVQPVNIMLRVRDGIPATFARRLTDVAAAIDPELHLRNIVGLAEALRKEQWIRRMEAMALASVSLSVLMLSSAGIYALMSFTVSQRRKEIGIRMALGADRTRIVASIFSRALGQLAIGAALGVASAALLERMSGDDGTRDNAMILAAVALLMMAVGCLAALGPARRCLGVEPTEALREQ